MCTTTRIDWLEEFTCLIVAWKSNLDDTRRLVQRFTVDYSYVSLNNSFFVCDQRELKLDAIVLIIMTCSIRMKVGAVREFSHMKNII
jgi:hypothetical protein